MRPLGILAILLAAPAPAFALATAGDVAPREAPARPDEPGAGVTADAGATAAHPDASGPGVPLVPAADRGAPGPPIVFGAPPALSGGLRACSFTLPLCVHAPAKARRGVVLRVLAAAERAWRGLTDGLGLPPPGVDLVTGAFDVFILPDVPGGARAELRERDPLGAFDRATSFVVVDGALDGCALDAALARATAGASLLRVAPATGPGLAAAETSYLARLLVPCALGAPGGIDAFQARPEASLAGAAPEGGDDGAAGPPADDYARGAALFPWWLDDSFGTAPGAIVKALWALAPTKTAPVADRWSGAPDGLDVLRVSFKDALFNGSTIDDLFLEFAVARAFVGAGADDEHMPETRALGAAGGVHLDWDVAWPTAPRRLASGRGLAPTGAAYVAVDCKEAPKGARLRFEATWEEHAVIRWAAVKVDAAGHELGQVAIPSASRATEAQFTVVDLDGVARVLFVGTNVGDPFFPYDPNDEAPEPHGWVVAVAGENP